MAFELWLSETYHTHRYSATNQSPFNKRFTAKLECVRTAPRDLKDHFRSIFRRKVNKDRTIMVQNRLFGDPVTLVGERVEVSFHESTPEKIEVKWKQKSYGFLTAVVLVNILSKYSFLLIVIKFNTFVLFGNFFYKEHTFEATDHVACREISIGNGKHTQ